MENRGKEKVWVQMNVVPRRTGNTNSGTEFMYHCLLKHKQRYLALLVICTHCTSQDGNEHHLNSTIHKLFTCETSMSSND